VEAVVAHTMGGPSPEKAQEAGKYLFGTVELARGKNKGQRGVVVGMTDSKYLVQALCFIFLLVFIYNWLTLIVHRRWHMCAGRQLPFLHDRCVGPR
jgi:hypothetical protein